MNSLAIRLIWFLFTLLEILVPLVGFCSDPNTTKEVTSVDAQICAGRSVGAGLVSSGFFLRPGDLFEKSLSERHFAVFIEGKEVPVFVRALHGRFNDGSVRSVLLQLNAAIPSTSRCLDAKVIFGRSVERSTKDLPPSAVTESVLRDQRVTLPRSPEYLSETWATFQPLLPASKESPHNRSYFTELFSRQFNILNDQELSSGAYQSTYESTRALAAAWQKSGLTDYYFNALTRALSLLEGYSLPNGTIDRNLFSPRLNPQSFPGVDHGGLPAEWHSQRYVGFAWAYLATGAEEYRNVINALLQSGMASLSTNEKATALGGWISEKYIGRFNVMKSWAAALGPLLDLSSPITAKELWGAGRQIDFDRELPWILDAWEKHRFTVGDYRNGLKGTSQNATNDGTLGPGELPHFQVALLSDFLLFYYLNVDHDKRAAEWACKNAEIVWDNNVIPLKAEDAGYPVGQVGYSYLMTSIPGRRDKVEPWTLPMWSSTLSFCNSFRGDNKFAKYYMWASDPKNVATSHLNWNWKVFGEAFGNVMSAPYFDQLGVPHP